MRTKKIGLLFADPYKWKLYIYMTNPYKWPKIDKWVYNWGGSIHPEIRSISGELFGPLY